MERALGELKIAVSHNWSTDAHRSLAIRFRVGGWRVKSGRLGALEKYEPTIMTTGKGINVVSDMRAQKSGNGG